MRYKNSWTKWAGIAVLVVGLSGMVAPRSIASSQTTVNAPIQQQRGNQRNSNYEAWLNNEVRHQLAMDPWYSIFDVLGYSVNGTEVTLSGQVVNPATKSDAASAVKHIEGVTKVYDNIEVLPPSPMDMGIRRAEYRAIFSYSDLYRYAMGANPSIHIIVENGHVTLVGNVDNKTDSQMAYMRANMVPGVFSVKNDLKVG